MNIRFQPLKDNPLSEAEIRALFDTHNRDRIKDAVVAVHGSNPGKFSSLPPEEQRKVLALLEPELPIDEKSALHVAALEYAARGRAVFPCVAGGKEPATPNGFKDATTDAAQIDAWWTANPQYNIAFCPEDVGLAIIDADSYREGCDVAALNLPETYEVETPRGGTHYYFVGSVPQTAGKPGKYLGEFIDTRGRGSYALLPPSSVDGKPYREKADRPIAVLPIEIEERLAKPEPAQSTESRVDLPGSIATARTRLADLVKAGRVAISGKLGHDTCYEVAAELVRDLGISAPVATELMLEIWYPHCEPNNDPQFVKDRVNSAARNGQNAIGAHATAPAAEVFADAKLPLPEGEQGKSETIAAFPFMDLAAIAKSVPPTVWDADTKLFIRALEGAIVLAYGAKGANKTGTAATVAVKAVFTHADLRVAYLAAEAPNDFIRSRLPPICEHLGHTLDELITTGRFQVIGKVPKLLQADDVAKLARDLTPFKPNLIILDTYGRATAGSRTNDEEVATKAYENAEFLRHQFKALVYILAHPGKDLSKGAKGASGLEQAADEVQEITLPVADVTEVYLKASRFRRDGGISKFRHAHYSKPGRYAEVPVLHFYQYDAPGNKAKRGPEIDTAGMDMAAKVVAYLRENQAHDFNQSHVTTKVLAAWLTGERPRDPDDLLAERKWNTAYKENMDKLRVLIRAPRKPDKRTGYVKPAGILHRYTKSGAPYGALAGVPNQVYFAVPLEVPGEPEQVLYGQDADGR